MSKFSKAILDLYDGALTASPDQFSEHGMLVTKALLNFNSAVIAGFSLGAAKKISIQTLHLHNVPIEKLWDRPRVTGTESLKDKFAIQSTDAIFVKAFQHQGNCIAADTSDVFRERLDAGHLAYCKKYETAHSLVLVNHKENNDIDVVALWRAQPKNSYSTHHINIGDQLLPHLLRANDINKRIANANMSEGQTNSINLIASASGMLYFTEPAAISLMQREWREWHPPVLPSVMMEAFKSRPPMQYSGKNLSAAANFQNGLLSIKITRKLNQSALTAAEARVAQMATQGLSNKEIAKIIGNSPATVRNQLHSVYQKLHVANKTSLAKLLNLRSST